MPDQLETIVQRMIDAGEPEDNIASVIQHFKTQSAPPQPLVRSRTGQLYTPPPDDPTMFKEMAQPFVDAINPMSYVRLAQSAYNDPAGTALNVAKTPVRIAGDLIGGNAPHALGEMATMLLAAKAPGMIRTAAGKGTEAALDLTQPLRPGAMTQEQIAARVGAVKKAGGLPPEYRKPAPTMGRLRTTPQAAPPTVGNLALKAEPEAVASSPSPMLQRPEFVPVGEEAAYNATQPVASHVRAEPTTPKEQVLRDLRERPDIVRDAQAMQARAADAKANLPSHPREVAPVASHAPTTRPMRFSSDLSDQPAPFGRLDTPSTGLEPGTPEARSMSAIHRYDAETVNRYRHMLDNENGQMSPDLMMKLAAGSVGLAELPRVIQFAQSHPVLATGAGLAGAAYRYPVQSAQTLRAAILAQLAAGDQK